MRSTVDAFNAAVAAGKAVPPTCLNCGGGGGGGGGGANPFTQEGLTVAVMAHVQTQARGGGVVGNALIAPNNVTQYGRVREQFGYI